MLHSYPAIVGCLATGRAPSRGELRRVAARVRRELYANGEIDVTRRRRIMRITFAALGLRRL